MPGQPSPAAHQPRVPQHALRVVIVGGGIAAAEALLAPSGRI